MRALSDLSTLVFLNLLTMLFCLPLVTAGASLAAMHYIIMETMEGRGGGLLGEFIMRFKQNLRSATRVWLILAVSGAFLYLDYRILSSEQAGFPKGALIPVYAAAIILTAVSVYALPLTARFENPTAATLKNAAILAVAYLPRTLVMMIIYAVVPYLFLNVTRLLPLFFILGLTLPAYFCALLYMPVFGKLAGERYANGEDEQEREKSRRDIDA